MLDFNTLPFHTAFVGAAQAAENAQQAGLAAAIGAFDLQHFSASQAEREPVEQQAVIARAFKVFGG